MQDIKKSRKEMLANQILTVSIVATPGSESTHDSIIEEYGLLAEMVFEAGAQVVEANLSCPNVKTGEGNLYSDVEMVGKIARRLREAVVSCPITMKMGYISTDSELRQVMRAANGYVDGLVLMNGVNSLVLNRDGTPVFGKGRETCGIIGRGLQPIALSYVKRARKIIKDDNLDLKVIGNGGIVSADCAEKYLNEGAYAVSIASGAIFCPHLAIEMKTKHPYW